MRLTLLFLLLAAVPAHAIEVVPRSIGSGSEQAYLHLQFQDGAIYVFNVHFDGNSVTTKEMVDAVAAELPLTYTTQWDGGTLYGLTYDGHHYEDWLHGFWSLWFSATGTVPWTYSQAGWMQLSAADTQWNGVVADPGLTFKASPSPIALVSSTGDFNADGRVDGLDFLVWQSGYPNSTGTATQWHGDGNGDGKVDGLDFLAWQAHYSPAGTPAPEPASAALLLIGAVALLRAGGAAKTTMTAGRSIRRRNAAAAFTLLELLVVIAIISLLVSITLPSLSMARRQAQATTCLANLHHLALAMSLYHANNNGSFWRCTIPDSPKPGVISYFWGSNTDPVDRTASPLLRYTDHGLELFWCEALPWGSYVPQGSVSEPTTTYAYNSWYLDPASYKWDFTLRPRTISQIPDPSALFVFADAATLDVWAAGGILKNSTHLEPPQETFVPTPTNHFRHEGRCNALCADGHAAAFDTEGADMALPQYDLGFVGRQNEPHYQQKMD